MDIPVGFAFGLGGAGVGFMAGHLLAWSLA